MTAFQTARPTVIRTVNQNAAVHCIGPATSIDARVILPAVTAVVSELRMYRLRVGFIVLSLVWPVL